MPLQLQMIPSEMLPLTKTEPWGGNPVRQGIEFDAIGRRVAYHFLRRHPGDVTDPGAAYETVRVPASEIIHVIDPVDAGQLRGVSRFAPGIVKLFLLDQYDDAELDRKKVAAMHALFITTPAPSEPFDAAEGESETGDRTLDLEPGQVVMLEPGEEIQTSAPADSGGTYEPFQYRTLLQVSAALGIPYAYLSNDMLKANYSNSRLALLEFRRRIEAYQHAVMVWQLCRRVWQRWLDVAVFSGALDLPGYDRAAARLRRLRLAAAEMGLGRSAEGCPRRDRADRGRAEEPDPGARRARLRRRAGRCRDRRRPGARGSAGPGLRQCRAGRAARLATPRAATIRAAAGRRHRRQSRLRNRMNSALLARLAGRPMALAPRALDGLLALAPEARAPFPAMDEDAGQRRLSRSRRTASPSCRCSGRC